MMSAQTGNHRLKAKRVHRRPLRNVAAACALVLAMMVAFAVPSSAASNLSTTLTARVDGQIHTTGLNLSVPMHGGMRAQLNLRTNQVRGSISLGQLTANIKVPYFGFLGVVARARISMVESSPVTGTVDPRTDVLYAAIHAYLRVDSLTALNTGVSLVPRGCSTASPVTIPVAGKLALLKPFRISGRFAVGGFAHCGPLTSILTGLLSRGGNTVGAWVTPLKFSA